MRLVGLGLHRGAAGEPARRGAGRRVPWAGGTACRRPWSLERWGCLGQGREGTPLWGTGPSLLLVLPWVLTSTALMPGKRTGLPGGSRGQRGSQGCRWEAAGRPRGRAVGARRVWGLRPTLPIPLDPFPPSPVLCFQQAAPVALSRQAALGQLELELPEGLCRSRPNGLARDWGSRTPAPMFGARTV